MALPVRRAFLMPAGDIQGLSSGAMVTPAAFIPVPQLGVVETEKVSQAVGVLRLPMGDGLLSRVVDSQGIPLDRGPALDGVVPGCWTATPSTPWTATRCASHWTPASRP
ncbi:hypothetical protein J4711_14410 [Staphylococcus epidermidis]|nr:hypothetical protein [Staphylococcus epidermidis]